ncbi:MAG: cobalt transporter CbiM [Leptolyngbyaceae cyanobacterium MO_188.B28]|nr:cobalt transporter CbiM [Leptolyngbyaceae cyanobacterium MO_188.B28]
MHIPDGILPAKIAISGYAVTGLFTWYSLKKINQLDNPQAQIPKASLMAAAFFVASWIHIPFPTGSLHLILNGLVGTVLGYFAFPAILIGLLFQAVMFQHGGLSTLGVNAAVMGAPALLAYHIFQLRRLLSMSKRKPQEAEPIFPEWEGGVTIHPKQPLKPQGPKFWAAGFGFLSGALGLGLSVLLVFALLIFHLPAQLDVELEQQAIYSLTLAHIPLVILEGIFTALLVMFLQQVKPELLKTQ